MNRLAQTTSPYLLQHAQNPVDWYPWGPEALNRSRQEERPILLSVGYSACHWCHVMEHESFSDLEVAEQMNRAFVCIKVDREERPDVDEIYMRATTTLNQGRGGWPMTVFLMPDGRPFFAGTYYPPTPRYGMPSFKQVLSHVERLWADRREDVAAAAEELQTHLKRTSTLPRPVAIQGDWLGAVIQACIEDYDSLNGGFGHAPKFPPHGQLAALLAAASEGHETAREMALHTLNAMAKGGMYDWVGGGFCRYSVDNKWLIPHFEKMLYDNGQLIPHYIDAFLLTQNPHYARIAKDSLDWALREMRLTGGGFASSLDADTEGVEGSTYVWTPAQLQACLGAVDGQAVAQLLQVREEGNFEHGTSALRLEQAIEQLSAAEQSLLLRSLAILKATRDQRAQPGRDDKLLVAWNAMMVSALAKGAVLDTKYLDEAEKTLHFLLDTMMVSGRLQRTWREGSQAHITAFADDYALLIQSCLDVYQACTLFGRAAQAYLDTALQLTEAMLGLFWDTQGGALFYTGHDAESLILRSQPLISGAEPSANAVAAGVLARLDMLLERPDLGDCADKILGAYAALRERAPRALGVEAVAAERRLRRMQIAVLGDSSGELCSVLRSYPLPFAVISSDPQLPWMEHKGGEGAWAYVCVQGACQLPVQEAAALKKQIMPTHRPEAIAPTKGLHTPGKIYAWSPQTPANFKDTTVFIADTGHHRILECHIQANTEGWPVLKVQKCYGDGQPGLVDGQNPRFRAPQGMVANAQFLYIADTGNHALRVMDRHTGSVKSLRHEGLRQPWDLVQVPEAEGAVFVAMAGSHQLWAWVPGTGEIGPLAGSEEGFSDGPSEQAQLSRPSGLALAGRYLFFVDASALRVLDLEQNQLGRLCGQAEAGDQDGKGAGIRLSRPLGITLSGEFLYIADTGNNKIKEISLRTLEIKTCASQLHAPQGVCIVGDFLLIADTQAHQIQALHLKSRVLRSVEIQT